MKTKHILLISFAFIGNIILFFTFVTGGEEQSTKEQVVGELEENQEIIYVSSPDKFTVDQNEVKKIANQYITIFEKKLENVNYGDDSFSVSARDNNDTNKLIFNYIIKKYKDAGWYDVYIEERFKLYGTNQGKYIELHLIKKKSIF